MAELKQRSSRRTTALLAAAIGASAAAILTAGADMALFDLTALAPIIGFLRPAGATLWILWFISRVVDRRSIAYSIGYVEGVTRRYPNSDTHDLARVSYLDR